MMELPQNTLDTARCLGCGYLLRGLEQPVCPECGREFNPNDPKSFAASSRTRIWRRWRWRFVGIFAFVLLLIVAAPRGSQTGSLTVTCANCKKSVTFKRWQLLPPKWMPRYPGYTWRAQAKAALNADETCVHGLSVWFSFKGGYVATSASITHNGVGIRNSDGTISTSPVTINGQAITFETADSDLRTLLDPMIAGVGP